MAIDRHADATFTTEQLVQRHTSTLAFDVPERCIDSTQRVHEDRAVAPVRALIHRLPKVFDIVRVFARQERSEVLFDCSSNGAYSLGKRCAAESVKARFARLDLDDAE